MHPLLIALILWCAIMWGISRMTSLNKESQVNYPYNWQKDSELYRSFLLEEGHAPTVEDS